MFTIFISTSFFSAVEAALSAPGCTVSLEGWLTPGTWGASLVMARHGVYIPISDPDD